MVDANTGVTVFSNDPDGSHSALSGAIALLEEVKIPRVARKTVLMTTVITLTAFAVVREREIGTLE
jgi:hypothetical protein